MACKPILGGCLKYVSFSPLYIYYLVKFSKLTSIFFRWVAQQSTRLMPRLHAPGVDARDTPLKFKIAKKWWLEDDPFLLGFGHFSGANC